jgi:hypothetical protein
MFFICTIYRTCEICGSIANNVADIVEVEMKEQWYEANNTFMSPPTGLSRAEIRSLRCFLLKFFLASMVGSFLICLLLDLARK